MSRPSYTVRQDYVGLGNLATYSFSFKIEALAQLLVVMLDATGTEIHRVRGTDTSVIISSVAFDNEDGAGTVTLLSNLPTNYKLILLLANDAPTQPSEFRNKFNFDLRGFENALDFLGGAIQRLAYLANRSAKVADKDDITAIDPTLPTPVANKFIRWNAAATALETATIIGGPGGGGTSTDNAVVLWDGTAGDALKNSTILARDLIGFVEVSAVIANNQSNTSVVGMLYTGIKAAHIHYVVKRIATSTVMETGTLMILFDGTTYTLQDKAVSFGDAGIDFSIDSVTGQVLYTTDNMAGVYDGVNSKTWWKYVKLLGA